MRLLLTLVISALSVFIASYLLPGVEVQDFWVALIVAVVLGLLNAVLKPILVILTLPLTLVTLGLFTFVINAGLVLLVDYLVTGFSVSSFWWALAFSLVVSLTNSFLNSLSAPKD